MVIETALGRIIAGALLFMDAVRSCFVITNFAGAGLDCTSNSACGLAAQYNANLTGCGRYIADMEAIEEILDLLPQVLAALGIG